MLGYYQGEEDGRIVCQGVDGWWDTGDRGYVDADGFLYIQGRAKTEYKLSNGKYVDPVYIGSLMSMVPGVDQAVVFGEGEAYNRAIVYSREGVSLQTVQSFLQGRVEPYEVPREIYFVEEPFSVQNGLLTQKLEPNRQKILAQFQKHDS
jgi:long-chain acyl-CoA synthetase